ILRKMAEKWIPRQIAHRRKKMFRAPLDSFHLTGPNTPKWIDQVLSPGSLRKTGYFDPVAVKRYRKAVPRMRRTLGKAAIEWGLAAGTATQLWHHLFMSGDFAELPTGLSTGNFRPIARRSDVIGQNVSVATVS